MTYVEPFVGGGAVLFWILQEYPNITRAVINDINAELICTYRVIKYDVENLILKLSRLQNEYLPLNEVDRKSIFLLNVSVLTKETPQRLKSLHYLFFESYLFQWIVSCKL